MKKMFLKLTALALALMTLLSFAVVFAEGVDYSQKTNLPGVKVQEEDVYVVEHGSVVMEAEDIWYEKSQCAYVVADEKASAGLAVSMPSYGWDISETPVDDMYAKIRLGEGEKTGNYKVWVRARTTVTDTHCFFWDLNEGIFNAYYFDNICDGEYRWICRSASINLYEDKDNYIAIRRRGPCMVDKIVITNDTSYDPKEMNDVPIYMTEEERDKWMDSYFERPEIKPIAGHPRLYFTPEYVKEYKENMWKSSDLSSRYQEIKKTASETIDCKLRQDLEYNNNYTLLGKILCRAFVYLMGDADKEHAKVTIAHMLDYMDTFRSRDDTSDITRVRGDILVDASIVYDWCYDALTEEDKAKFKAHMVTLASGKEIGFPPIGGRLPANMASHSGEQELLRDLLAAGIALYDEYPTFYNVAAGRLFELMIPARKWMRAGGRVEQGNDYGECRYYSEMWADLAIMRMGYPSVYGDIEGNVAEWFIRTRLPYGDRIADNDMYTYQVTSDDKYITSFYHILYGIAGNLYNRPDLKMEYERTMAVFGINIHNLIYHMIISDPTVPVDTYDDLPLAKAASYPVSGVIARTSWQEGKKSNSAVGYVDMHEVYVGDHQHMATGAFQIAYKGPLAINTGDYAGSMDHYHAFYQRSISSNVLLCKDPNEVLKCYDIYKVLPNDGGQRHPYTNEKGDVKEASVQNLSEYELDENGIIGNKDLEVASDVKTYIGPNEITPEFTYITGDLTNAYTDKVTDYHRSVVFMDLFDENYPAAMVVFDKMSSADKSFKKTWILNSNEEPTIEKDTTVITRTEEGFDGKLVNRTLIPARSNTKFEIIGGNNNEIFRYDGYNAPPANGYDQVGKYRVEISPKVEAKDDNFLNAMYVTSASANLPELPMFKETGAGYVGVTIKDRFVAFTKEAVVRDDSFNVNIRNNGYDEVSCLLGDMKEGIWTIEGKGVKITAESKKGENVIYFKAAPGNYRVTKTECDNIEPDKFTYEAQPKQKVGDFMIWNNMGTPSNVAHGSFVYLEKPTENKDGNACVAVDVLKQFGAAVTLNYGANSATIVCGENTVTLTAGSNNYILNGQNKTFKFTPYMSNGTIYVKLKEFEDIINYKVSWKDNAKMIFVEAINNSI